MPRKRPKLTPAESRVLHLFGSWIIMQHGDEAKAPYILKTLKRFVRDLPDDWRELVRTP